MDDDRIRANGPVGRAVRPWRRLAFVGGACLVVALVLLALPSLLRRAEAAAPCAPAGSVSLQQSCRCSCRDEACGRGTYCGTDSDGNLCACQCDATVVPPPTEATQTTMPTQAPTEPPGGTPPPPSPPPAPTATPEPGIDCFNCYPWALCPGHYARVCFRNDGSNYYLISADCQSASQCSNQTPTPPPSATPTPEPPCVPNPPEVTCEGTHWGYHIWVEARVPPHRVQVIPFPRWLVAMGAPLPAPYESGEPGRLILQDDPAFTPPELCAPNGPGFSAGCWSDAAMWPERGPNEEPQRGDIRNYRLGLRWRRVRADRPNALDLGVPPLSCWFFDEREWNIGANYGYGPIYDSVCGATEVTHVYETSSWGKPRNGARFLPPEQACPRGVAHCCEQVPEVWDMPAYQVRVNTFWQAEWNVKWESYELVGVGDYGDDSTCFCRPQGAPTGVPHVGCGAEVPACSGCNGWCGKVAEPVYDWVQHEQGWAGIDLRRWLGQWYYEQWQVCSGGAGPWCAFEYGTCGGAVPVPVIEVQSVLRDPCILDGSCPPGYP